MSYFAANPDDFWLQGERSGTYYYDRGGPYAHTYRAKDGQLSFHNRDTQEWEDTSVVEVDPEHSDLTQWRIEGSPRCLHVHIDGDRCIMTNLIWNMSDSPEVAQVVDPHTNMKFQISPADLEQKPFMIQHDNLNTVANDKITILFDNASTACDNETPIGDSRVIQRDRATVLSLMRTIRCMRRMYPSSYSDYNAKCSSQYDIFVNLAKIDSTTWKVNARASRRRSRR